MKPAKLAVRQNDLAAIHIAKKQLGLDENAYRDLMATVCGGVRSAADLDTAGRQRLPRMRARQARPRGAEFSHPNRSEP